MSDSGYLWDESSKEGVYNISESMFEEYKDGVLVSEPIKHKILDKGPMLNYLKGVRDQPSGRDGHSDYPFPDFRNRLLCPDCKEMMNGMVTYCKMRADKDGFGAEKRHWDKDDIDDFCPSNYQPASENHKIGIGLLPDESGTTAFTGTKWSECQFLVNIVKNQTCEPCSWVLNEPWNYGVPGHKKKDAAHEVCHSSLAGVVKKKVGAKVVYKDERGNVIPPLIKEDFFGNPMFDPETGEPVPVTDDQGRVVPPEGTTAEVVPDGFTRCVACMEKPNIPVGETPPYNCQAAPYLFEWDFCTKSVQKLETFCKVEQPKKLPQDFYSFCDSTYGPIKYEGALQYNECKDFMMAMMVHFSPANPCTLLHGCPAKTMCPIRLPNCQNEMKGWKQDENGNPVAPSLMSMLNRTKDTSGYTYKDFMDPNQNYSHDGERPRKSQRLQQSQWFQLTEKSE